MGWVTSPAFLRRFHGWATVIWTFLLVPSVLWWKDSVPWVVAMSCYANVAGHWAAWQASRTEELQHKQVSGEVGT